MTMNARARATLVLGACLSCIAACGTDVVPRTEIVIVVDSDLDAPSEIDSISVHVRRESSTVTQTQNGPVMVEGERRLPLTVGLLDSAGTLEPIVVTAEARKDDDVIVSQRAQISFVKNKRMVLHMNLVRACMSDRKTCPSTQTCIDGACAGLGRDDELMEWDGLDGGLPISDAAIDGSEPTDAGHDGSDGMIDAGGEDAGDAGDLLDAGDGGALEDGAVDAGSDTGPPCISVPETCNGVNDDCDENIDEGFTPYTSLEHCGSCTNACPTELTNAHSICAMEQGQEPRCVTVCDALTANCDGDDEPEDEPGCEVLLTTEDDCGACNVQCSGMTPLCGANGSGGVSCVGACGALTLCDESSCVNTEIDPLHCGGCAPCAAQDNATASCDGGDCEYACLNGYDSCTDQNVYNGCETNTRTDVLHCGECDEECPDVGHSTPRCTNSDCGYDCDPGYTDCNQSQPGGSADGCEIHTDVDVNNCGNCQNICPDRTNAMRTCNAGTCSFMCNAGRGNCDGSAANGCETNTNASKTHCGGCLGSGGRTCGALEGCCGGVCRLLSLGC